MLALPFPFSSHFFSMFSSLYVSLYLFFVKFLLLYVLSLSLDLVIGGTIYCRGFTAFLGPPGAGLRIN